MNFFQGQKLLSGCEYLRDLAGGNRALGQHQFICLHGQRKNSMFALLKQFLQGQTITLWQQMPQYVAFTKSQLPQPESISSSKIEVPQDMIGVLLVFSSITALTLWLTKILKAVWQFGISIIAAIVIILTLAITQHQTLLTLKKPAMLI